jgi:Xaa-Pro aminopeptidase
MILNISAFPILITNPINIRYLTGFSSFESNLKTSFLLVTKKNLILFTNSLHINQAIKLTDSIANLTVVNISEINNVASVLNHLLSKNNYKTLLFEADNIVYTDYIYLKNKLINVRLIHTYAEIETLRQIKDDKEIHNISQACKICDIVFKELLSYIKLNITEKNLYYILKKIILSKNCDLAFDPIVAFGKNASEPHYTGYQDRKLKKSDSILLDFGVKYHDYCSDFSRSVVVGSPSSIYLNVYNQILNLRQILEKDISDGQRSGKVLDHNAKNFIKKHHLPPYSHSLGHGLGLLIHESPLLTINRDDMLKINMVFTLEPAVYLKGKFGIRIEDTVMINKNNKFVSLTKSQKNLIMI